MPDPKLDISITTSADTSGAKQATEALKGTGAAAAEAGSKTKVAGGQAKEGFDKFSKAGNDAASVVNNLETASKGGVAGLFGLANAMRQLIGIVRTAAAASGPIGLLVTVLGTLVGLFLALKANSQAAVWNVALTDEEMASLAAGCSPLRVRPSALVFYAPLSPGVFDYRAGVTITNNNTSTVSADHPRIYRSP